MHALRTVRTRWQLLRHLTTSTTGSAVRPQRNTLRWMVGSVLFWLPLGIFVTEYGFNIKSVKGRSMQPTLNPDDSPWRDIVLFDRFSVRHQRLARGDVVALKSPTDSKLIVKRIIAFEGDVVRTLPPYPDAEVLIPPGHAWVEGDESFRTEDSNRFGPVPLGLIESKLSYTLWPWERIGALGQPFIVRSNNQRGSPEWRRTQADFEREKWRNSRVTVASSSLQSPSDS